MAGSIPCGPDVDGIVKAVSPYWEAGFTDVAIVQVGDEGQDRFLTRGGVRGSDRTPRGRPVTALGGR